MDLRDLFEIDTLLENFENIRTPEDLQYTIQSAQDVFSKYAAYIKKIPSDLERWQDTLKNLGVLSENTDIVSEAKDMIFTSVYNASKGTIFEGKLGLESLLKSEKTQNLYYSIGNIKIDYVYNLKPRYRTRAESQPIVSSKDLDRLNEHAENENPVYTMQVGLKGDDVERRFSQILSLKDSKKIIKIVTSEVVEKCLITDISLTRNNMSGIIFDITFQNVFIAQLKRTANRLIINTETTAEEVIPAQQEVKNETVKETVSNTNYIGIVTPITYQNYSTDSASIIGYGGRSGGGSF